MKANQLPGLHHVIVGDIGNQSPQGFLCLYFLIYPVILNTYVTIVITDSLFISLEKDSCTPQMLYVLGKWQ